MRTRIIINGIKIILTRINLLSYVWKSSLCLVHDNQFISQRSLNRMLLLPVSCWHWLLDHISVQRVSSHLMWFSHFACSFRSNIGWDCFCLLLWSLIIIWTVWIVFDTLFTNEQVKEGISYGDKNEENKDIHNDLSSSWASRTERIEPTDRISRLSEALTIIIEVWKGTLGTTCLSLTDLAAGNGLTTRLTVCVIGQDLISIRIVSIVAGATWVVVAAWWAPWERIVAEYVLVDIWVGAVDLVPAVTCASNATYCVKVRICADVLREALIPLIVAHVLSWHSIEAISATDILGMDMEAKQ